MTNKDILKRLEAIEKVMLKAMYGSRQPTVKQVEEAKKAMNELEEHFSNN